MAPPMKPEERSFRRKVIRALGFDDSAINDQGLIPSKTLIASLIVTEALGFSIDETRKMARRRPTMLRLSPRQVSDVWFLFRLMGFTHAELRRMMLDSPQLWTASLEKLWTSFQDLLKYGFQQYDLLHIVVAEPSIMTFAIERNRRILRNLEKRGFTKSEIVRMAFRAPMFLNNDSARTNAVLDFLEKAHGKTLMHDIIRADPGIARNEPARLRQHLDIQRYVGADPVARANTNAFSPKLLRGRIVFLESRGQKKWPGSLYESNPQFQRRLGVTRDDMIALDPGPEAFSLRSLASQTA